MKIIKALAGVTFVVGMFLIMTAVGTDDFYVMELQQAHTMNFGQVVLGLIMCVPFPVINHVGGANDRKAV